MFVKIRIHYVLEEKFIFGSELPLLGLEEGEWPAKAGGIYDIFNQISQFKQVKQTPVTSSLFDQLPLSHIF